MRDFRKKSFFYMRIFTVYKIFGYSAGYTHFTECIGTEKIFSKNAVDIWKKVYYYNIRKRT